MNVDLSEAPTMIIGFPDETVIPTKVCGEIVDALKLPFIGTISADFFNSGKTLVRNGIPFYPIRLYGEKELVLAMTELEFKKSSQSLLKTVFNLLMQAAGLLKVSHIVSIAGQNEITTKQRELLSSNLKGFCEKKVQFLTTDCAVAKRLEDKGYEPIEDMTLKGINHLLLRDLPFPLIGAPELTIVANVNNKSDGWSIVCLLLMICAVVQKKGFEFEKFSSRDKSSLARLELKTRGVNSALKESAARMWL